MEKQQLPQIPRTRDKQTLRRWAKEQIAAGFPSAFVATYLRRASWGNIDGYSRDIYKLEGCKVAPSRFDPDRQQLNGQLIDIADALDKSVDTKINRAYSLRNAGRFDDAIAILANLVAKGDLSGMAVDAICSFCAGEGRIDEPIQYCEQQLKLLQIATKQRWYATAYGNPSRDLAEKKRRLRIVLQRLMNKSRSVHLTALGTSVHQCKGAWIVTGVHSSTTASTCNLPGRISVAWREIGDLISTSYTDLGAKIAACFHGRASLYLKTTMIALGHFRFGMKLNDPVVSYCAKDNTWLTGKINGDYKHDPAADEMRPHTRSVDWTGKLNEDEIPSVPRRRLHNFRTVCDIGVELWTVVSDLAKQHVKIDRKPVPRWDKALRKGNATQSERDAFWRHFVNSAANGEYLDVEGNISYVFEYLYHLKKQCEQDGNVVHLTKAYEAVREAYGHFDSVCSGIDASLESIFWQLGDFDLAWEHGRKRFVSVSRVLSIRSKCADTTLDGCDVLAMSYAKGVVTAFGQKHIDSLRDELTGMLAQKHTEEFKNFVEEFCSRFDMFALTERDFAALHCVCRDEEREFTSFRQYYGSGPETDIVYRDVYKGGIRHRDLWWDFGPQNKRSRAYVTEVMVPPVIELAVNCLAKEMVRTAENRLRERQGLPHVGKGWISESSLFREIQESFPELTVIQHWRAGWLDRQHLDIYIPEIKVALEYQGIQHSYPIDYFGGIDAFDQLQKRDRLKAKLCRDNGVRLIIVHPGYSRSDVIEQISALR